MIEPCDELMADRGFKIIEDLMMHMAIKNLFMLSVRISSYRCTQEV